ncbi:MAG: 3-hydroxyacyl-CoA dehydrogenase family protein [Acidobacteriota bacterium]
MSADNLRVATVLGAGTMGAGIAQVCAQAGLATRLYDIEDAYVEKGQARILGMLDKGVAKGKVTQEQRDATVDLLTTTSDLDGALDEDVDVVIEAVPERLELKQQLFTSIGERVTTDCLVASNTSSLPITTLAESCALPERFIGLHFFNPVPLMKLLEIVVGEKTSDATVTLARAFGERLGKDPIVVRDAPGFASSRLGIALGLEAMRMVEEEVASAEDIDKAMKLGYRHPMGPLELTDLVGLDVRLDIADHLARELSDERFKAPQLLRDMVERGDLGKKSGEGFYNWAEGKAEPK